jgi:hypothetical protein
VKLNASFHGFSQLSTDCSCDDCILMCILGCVFQQVLQEEGWRGFFRGLGPSLVGTAASQVQI